VWGPGEADGTPALTTIRARRYECQLCGACMIVVPSEILPGRLYSGPAIALALALWALFGLASAAVRTRISPFSVVGAAAVNRWITLRRWATDAREGRLFWGSRAAPKDFTLRQHAERTAASLRALAPAGLELADAVFAGGALHRPP
jgi:hypothetical protein